MLGYSIKLKAEKTIREMCYEVEEGGSGLDGIAYNAGLIKTYNFKDSKVVDVLPYGEDNEVAFIIQCGTGEKLPIHYKWIGYIEGLKVTSNYPDTTLIKVTTTKFLDTKTGHISDVSDHPLCSCGEIATVKVEKKYKLCEACATKAVHKNNYSYKPDYKFIGSQIKSDEDTPVWYGLEVEMSTDKRLLRDFMYKHSNSVYLKDDSSIRGSGYNVEMVSMPHSFSALMGKDSWLSQLNVLPYEDHNANGCHVHISRTAFVSDKHYSLFYFLMYKMEKIATKVGGRDLTDYCQLLPTGKVHSKKNAKTEGRGRSLFLNEQNTPTVEARFFKGTTKAQNLRAYVQFLESIIKYTKYHSTTVSAKGWFAYMTKKSKKYADLIAVVGSLDELEAEEAVVTYREPKTIQKVISKLTLSEFGDVITIKTDIHLYTGVKIKHYVLDENRISFYFEDDSGYRESTSVDITSITELTLEV